MRPLGAAGPLLAGALLAGCGEATQPSGSRPTAPAVHAPLCYPQRLSARRPCRSPDGAWTVEWRPGRLVLTRDSTGKQTIDYRSRDACCDDITWVPPQRLVFADDYRVFTLDPATRKVTFVAGFSDFFASPDGRWVAGYAYAPPDEPQLAGLVSLATGRCVLIPGRNDYVGSSFAVEGGTTPRTGFSPTGDAVVVAILPSRGVFLYRISALRRPCPPSMTRQP